MEIDRLSRLSFFMVDKYEYQNSHVCDFRAVPRPHYCMGLLLEGSADFTDNEGKTVHIEAGDIIFVPISSTYRSVWQGSPRICYISMHFAFEINCSISEKDDYLLQKIRLPEFEKTKQSFLLAQENYNNKENSKKMGVLGIFFSMLEQLMPLLKKNKTVPTDTRIEKIKEYINLHSEKKMTIEELAKIGMMSVSNLHLLFKKYTNMSPIEYKNRALISRAMRLLKSDPYLSIEEVSDMLGFESSVYFRRIFKQYTGKTPKEYRQAEGEI